MAVKIQLTPQELLAQSQEMKSLQAEYETLFGQSQTLLGQVNANWSANLANNFAGKILSAQKSFGQITSMLEAGGNLAQESARTFESMDSLLAKNMNGSGGTASMAAAVGSGVAGIGPGIGAGLAAIHPGGTVMTAASDVAASVKTNISSTWNGFVDSVISQTKKDWETAGDALQAVSDWYENLPKEKKGILDLLKDKFIPGQLNTSYQTARDIITGEVDWDTGKRVAKEIIGGTKFSIIEDAFKYASSDKIQELDRYYMESSLEQFKQGNVIAGITNMAGSFLDEVGMGVVKGIGNLATGAISKIPGVSFLEEQLGFNIKEGWSSFSDKMQDGFTEGIRQTVEVVGKVEEAVRDVAVDGIKAVADGAGKVLSAAGDGLKAIGSGIGKFFKW